jgi:hypothetical protein
MSLPFDALCCAHWTCTVVHCKIANTRETPTKSAVKIESSNACRLRNPRGNERISLGNSRIRMHACLALLLNICARARARVCVYRDKFREDSKSSRSRISVRRIRISLHSNSRIVTFLFMLSDYQNTDNSLTSSNQYAKTSEKLERYSCKWSRVRDKQVISSVINLKTEQLLAYWRI